MAASKVSSDKTFASTAKTISQWTNGSWNGGDSRGK
jgi:hypothetical protein